jgi:ABC-type branched-subunit amino acid transport system ATPase component
MSELPFTHLSVDGFRGLRALQVADLRNINVLVGGNNSGKTSVLEALALMANPADGNEWLQVIRRRDFGGLDESPVVSLRWCFRHEPGARFASEDELELSCQFGAEGAHPLRKMQSTYRDFWSFSSPPRVVQSPGDRWRIGPAELPRNPVRACTINSDLTWASPPDPLADEGAPIRFPAQASALSTDEAASRFAAVAWRGGLLAPWHHRLKCEALLPYSYQLNTYQVIGRSAQLFQDDTTLMLDLIRQFDPDVLNVEVASFGGLRPAVYVKHKKLGVAPLSVFGDAMRRCFLMATTMISLGKGGVLLLDEVEVGIHTEALPKVFKWLSDAARQMQVQVFATTHSLEVVDALLAAGLSEDELAAFKVQQTDERTECKRFSATSLKRLRFERGLDIR